MSQHSRDQASTIAVSEAGNWLVRKKTAMPAYNVFWTIERP